MQLPSHAERSRTVVGEGSHGSLSTIALHPAGYPFGSLVAYALDPMGHPLLLLSDLAEHSHNLKANPRCSLLVVEGGLAQARVTLLGEAYRANDARERYLERHPNSAHYADFKDFQFYCLQVQSIRYVGGFGRMSWVNLMEYQEAEPDPLAPHRQGIIEHMNEDHKDAMLLLAEHLGGVSGQEVSMIEVDRYGCELTVDGKYVRLNFSRALERPDQVRKEFVTATKAAREALNKS